MILNVLLSILDENQAMKHKLDEALAEKAEIDLVNSKADSVDRTIIEALKREGEEQKEKVQILLSNDLENACIKPLQYYLQKCISYFSFNI